MYVAMFMRQCRPQAILPSFIFGEFGCDFHDRFPARIEFRDTFNICSIFREVGIAIEVISIALNKFLQIFGGNRKLDLTINRTEKADHDAFALLVEFLWFVVRPLSKAAGRIPDIAHHQRRLLSCSPVPRRKASIPWRNSWSVSLDLCSAVGTRQL